jgi:HEAT repeat protein
MSFWGPPDIEELKAKGKVQDLIHSFLNNTNPDIRCKAAQALGDIGNAQAIKPLVDVIKSDSEYDIRRAAAEALCRINDDHVIIYLVDLIKYLLDYKSSPVYSTINSGIEKIGKPAVNLLITLLNTSDSEEEARLRSIILCARIGDPCAVEPLIATLGDSNDRVRRESAEALGKFMDPRAVEPLIATLGDSNDGVRRESAVALGKLMDSRAVEPLIGTLGDNNSDVRSESAIALGNLMDPRAAEPLIAVFGDSNEKVRRESAFALGKLMDPRAIELLKTFLKNANVPREVPEALEKLGWQPDQDEDGARFWISLYKYDNCIGIGKLAVEPLIKRLKSEESSHHKIPIVNALGEIGDTGAIEALIDALKTELTDLRNAIIAALNKIDPEWKESEIIWDVIPQLIDTLNDRGERNKIKSMWALVEINSSLAVQPIIALLKDDNDHVAAEAARVLGILKDTSAIGPLKEVALKGIWEAKQALKEFGEPDPNLEADNYKKGGTIMCPDCKTIYNRSVVIDLIKQQSPEIFYFPTWSTKFICKKCRAHVVISGVKD